MDDHGTSVQAKPTKGVVFAIFLLAVFAAIFGIIRFRQQLYSQKNENSRRATLAKQTEQQTLSSSMNEALALQQKDTDGDGLSDYDELNRYKTSPYLKDSDSDGYDDKAEIASGNDPNCPKGQECTIAAAPSAAPHLETSPLPSPVRRGDVQGEGGGTGQAQRQSEGVGTGQALPPFTPDSARAMLRQAGLTETQIQQFDDATLKQMYDEAVAKVQVTSPNPLLQGEGAIQQYTPAQIREILKANGISEQMLQGVDDATLQKLFEDAMKNSQQ